MPTSKQCSKCEEFYDYAVAECPACGYKGYKLIEVRGPVRPGTTQEVQAPEGAAPPVVTAAQGPVGPPWQPARAAGPATVNGTMSAVAVLAWFPGVLMAVSFCLVWVQASILSGTYFKILETALNNLDDAMKIGGPRVLALFIPAAAAAMALAGAAGVRNKAGGVLLMCSGGLGLIAAWQVHDYLSKSGTGLIDLTGALGPGFWLFALASGAALGVGLLAIVASEQPAMAQQGLGARLAAGGAVAAGGPWAESQQPGGLDACATLGSAWAGLRSNPGPLVLSSLILLVLGAVSVALVQKAVKGPSGQYINMLLSFLISVPLVVGIMGLALKTLRGEQMQVSDFFDGFRFPQIKNGYVAVAGPSLLWAVLNAVVMPASLTAGLGQTSTAAPAGLYGRLGLIALIWLFAYPFVALLYPAVAQGFSGMDALKLSLQRGRDNWVQLFLVILLTALIGTIAAAVTCGLGLVLALPWCFCVLGRTYLVLMEGGAPVATVIRRLGPSTATQRPAPPPSSAEASGQTRRYAAVAAVCVLVISGAFGVSRVAPAIGKRMAVAAANSCQTNLRQAGLAMLMYVQDYDGHMPHGAEWCDAIQPYVKNLQICTCPALRGRKGGYALNDSLVGQRVTGAQNPAQTIMLFDASSGWNADGGSGLMAFRHLGASNVCYAEGHVSAAFAGNPYVARGFDTANAPGGPGFTSTLPPSGAPGPGKPGAPEPPGPPPGAPPTGAPPGAAPAPQEAQAPEGVRVFDVQTGIGLTPDCRRPLRATSRFPASTHEVDVTYAETAPPNCFWTVAVRLYRNGRHLPSFDDASAPSADGRGHEEFVWNGGAPPGRYSIRFLWNGAQVGEGQFTVGS